MTCRRSSFVFASAAAPAVYEGVARDALMRFKLGGERRAGLALGSMMARQVPAEVDLLTFVPATRSSVGERGFNPAEVLARAVGRNTGLRHEALLRKVRSTNDSAGLGRTERRANLRGAFAPTRRVAGVCLVVDDILTTGATADACASALLGAGAGAVHILTFARTPERP